MREVELAIIGGGPAGICAAIEAVKCNVQVTLIEENSRLGGQFYRRLADGFAIVNQRQLDKYYVQGTKLIAEIEQCERKVELMENALIWGIFPDKEVALLRDGKTEILKAQRLILAEGAYDRPAPFPGWTLPGVLTAGAALRMVKTEKVLPGERILLAGTGPLQLLLAAHLVRNGAKVVAVLEASSLNNSWRRLPHLWGQWELLKDGLGYLWELRKAKVPLLRGHAIIEAKGEEQVYQAIYAKVDKDWQIVPGTEKNVEVDTIITGYGLIPSGRLSGLCGCRQKWDTYLGGWIPEHDEYMETALPGIFTVGDCSGIEGAAVAAEEGRLAAIKICQELGHITLEEASRRCSPIFKKLRGLRRFESALSNIFAIRRGLLAQIPDEVIICRCEEVTAGEIQRVIAEGMTNVNEIKALTRAGMGPCQGRMCAPIIAEIVSIKTKRPVEKVGFFTPRPPIKPIPLVDVARHKSSREKKVE